MTTPPPIDDTKASGRSTRRRRRPAGEAPPLPREFSRSAWILVGSFAAFAVLWPLAPQIFPDSGIWFNETEGALIRALADNRIDWVTSILETVNSAGYSWAVPIVGWGTIALLLAARRIRHLVVFYGSLVVVTSLSSIAAVVFVTRNRPWGVEHLAPWEGFAHPSLPVAQLTAVLVGAAFSLVPRARRRWIFELGIALAVLLFGFSRVYLGVEHPMDGVEGAIIGAAVMVASFLAICPEKVFPVGFQHGKTAHLDIGGRRGEAIRTALHDQLGIDVSDIEPAGLSESAGSTPMRLTLAGDESKFLFGKLYARSHLRSDRWYKLSRTLLYGRLEDEAHFENVRRLVEYEDYLLRLMRNAGIRSPAPVGIAVITPEREYLIVTEFLQDAVEIGDAEVGRGIIDSALLLVRSLWDHGLAHRDIKPSNIMIREEQAFAIDVAFGEVRPSPWREAIDLANMMLVLALGSTPDLVFSRALEFFSEDEIAEAFAASRSITIPGQLRRELKADGRDLVGDFRNLAPPLVKVSIQRWSLRRVALAIWVLLLIGAGVALGFSNLEGLGLL
jgi:tRNA A-37 threonylcarbamoyl transferase component Bud32/membrane-associated phospholipid phosphatase